MRAVGPVDGARSTATPVVDARRGRSAAAPSSAWAARRSAARSQLEDGRGRTSSTVDYPAARPTSWCAASSSAPAPVPAGDHIERAAAAAAGADVAIVDRRHRRRLGDRGRGPHVAGPAAATRTSSCAAVAAANPNTIVVLNTGSPVTMPWLDDVPAVLQLWFPGQEIGDALADVLTGDAEPGGRLPVTFPRRLEDTPAFAHYPGVGRPGRVRRGAVHRAPLVRPRRRSSRCSRSASGSATRRSTLDAPAVERRRRARRHRRASTSRNTGARAGGEVVQVYVEPPAGDPARPLRHLAGFAPRRPRAGERGDGARSSSTAGRSPRGSTAPGSSRPASTSILVGRSSRDLQPAGTSDPTAAV